MKIRWFIDDDLLNKSPTAISHELEIEIDDDVIKGMDESELNECCLEHIRDDFDSLYNFGWEIIA